MFRTLFPEINKSRNLVNEFLPKKSDYLKYLEKRKIKSYRNMNKARIELIKQKIIKPFFIERNYKIFSRNDFIIDKNHKSKFYYTPNIRQIFLSPEESEYYKRYKPKNFDIDNFSLIYKTTNSTEYPKREVYKSKINEKSKTIDNSRRINKNKNNNKSIFDSHFSSFGSSIIFSKSRYNSSLL